MATSIRDIYVTGLQNAHALEAQAIQLCQRQVERLENYPELRERLREHLEESRRQQQRIEQILQTLGTSHSTLKDIGTSIMGNIAAIGHAVMQDEVMKNTFANYAFEHFEIASYRALMEMADAAGDTPGQRLLEQSLNEEIRMAEFIDQHLSTIVRRHIERETKGMKSGV
jgi:ferritin-like metal-binding protein YciE